MRSVRFLILLMATAVLASCAPASLGLGDAAAPGTTAATPNGHPEVGDTDTAAPSPEPIRVPEGGWPDASNTGVPDGTTLTPWTGDCTITEPGTVIDARVVECDLRVRAPDVVITNSRIFGTVTLRHTEEDYSFSISDSEVVVGPRMATGLGNGHFKAERIEISGGRRSVNCSVDCTIEHSWVHAQAGDSEEKEAHLSGIRMGQDTTIRFNTIICEGERIPPASGCSAALTGYGDFRPVQNNLIEGNLFQSGTASFCAFGGSTNDKPFSDDARDIRFLNNVFERDENGSCGIHAPIEAFDSDAPGNLWEGNVWDDGEPLPPRN